MPTQDESFCLVGNNGRKKISVSSAGGYRIGRLDEFQPTVILFRFL